MLRGALSVALAAGVAAFGAGCGDTRCGGNDRQEGGGAPVLENFFLVPEQVPGDPWTIILGADFTDDDGDLGSGKADFYLNEDTQPTEQELTDVFRQSGVGLSEKSGSLWMALRFASTVRSGTTVRLGLQLVDKAGRYSNCYTLDLDFEVTAVAAGVPAAVKSRQARCGAALRNHRHG
ncbi:MAG: hypothetical protein HY903_10620 [Deltaproteobacteria bacterium]|nr:hypothetical protein [Deltaproteobacteria bacterium]